jgi:hypothetical protein
MSIQAKIAKKGMKVLDKSLSEGLIVLYQRLYGQLRREKITKAASDNFKTLFTSFRTLIARAIREGGSEFQRVSRIAQRIKVYTTNPIGLVDAMKPSTDAYVETLTMAKELAVKKTRLIASHGEESPKVREVSQQLEACWNRRDALVKQIRDEFEVAYNLILAGNPSSSLPANLNEFIGSIKNAANRVSVVNETKNIATNQSSKAVKFSM